jgi:GDPmannose 4,6-dehydratase
VEIAAAHLGITLAWKGAGVDEQGIVEAVAPYKAGVGAADVTPGDVVVRVDPMYFRPAEVETLLGDPAKAKSKLGWQPRISFEDMVKEMVAHDMNEAGRDALCRKEGFTVCNYDE